MGFALPWWHSACLLSNSPLMRSIVTTGYFIGQIIGAGFLGNVISKVGHIRAFAIWHKQSQLA